MRRPAFGMRRARRSRTMRNRGIGMFGKKWEERATGADRSGAVPNVARTKARSYEEHVRGNSLIGVRGILPEEPGFHHAQVLWLRKSGDDTAHKRMADCSGFLQLLADLRADVGIRETARRTIAWKGKWGATEHGKRVLTNGHFLDRNNAQSALFTNQQGDEKIPPSGIDKWILHTNGSVGAECLMQQLNDAVVQRETRYGSKNHNRKRTQALLSQARRARSITFHSITRESEQTKLQENAEFKR
ncbi:uncharacterized protein LAESUDRAFT_718361 [Laetiporus sulphureus 93-53]|uniref:Uncharacterized protein n=1 Tax=Laetiporus sulphureus 93-53 TaxID=1314785 RepID=A0A165B1K5_9APHY|nr:uncharacterized protein LAESUDRAFT_718361 [Laetiporus sulphureus 93-53]KZT00058.1 hypothetical protein LAESUDRAFT_718361 [Laetiporus sulphureus 93-53]